MEGLRNKYLDAYLPARRQKGPKEEPLDPLPQQARRPQLDFIHSPIVDLGVPSQQQCGLHTLPLAPLQAYVEMHIVGTCHCKMHSIFLLMLSENIHSHLGHDISCKVRKGLSVTWRQLMWSTCKNK